MKTQTHKAVFHPCDFCKAKGILDIHIFNKDGWYFCIPCLQDMAATRTGLRRQTTDNKIGGQPLAVSFQERPKEKNDPNIG